MEALTHGQISQLEETFNRLDSRGAGTLSANDISFVLSTIGVKVAPHDVKPLLNSLGLNRQSQDGDVSVTFSAFVTLMSHPFEVGETDASAPFLARAIQKLFALTAVGAPASTGAVRLTALSDITDRELMRAFSVLDADGDGVLSYDDLIITLPTFDPAITPHHVSEIIREVGALPPAGAPPVAALSPAARGGCISLAAFASLVGLADGAAGANADANAAAAATVTGASSGASSRAPGYSP